ncbi:MAG: hypothetical protein H6724_08530 [Sandaracinus sp.]|nr:hypothetical protein [Sandaracinus sp.]
MNLHVADVNGDRRDDLVCHDPVRGTLSVDLAASAPAVYGTIDGIPVNWCFHTGAQLTLADANGDGRTDAVCATAPVGDVHIDFASTSGRFDGVATFRALNFCRGTNRRFLAGRFDAEGPHEGLLCDDSTGRTIRSALFLSASTGAAADQRGGFLRGPAFSAWPFRGGARTNLAPEPRPQKG